MKNYVYPDVMGRPITREEIMEGLWECYNGMVKYEKSKDSSVLRFPDMETILNHIQENGLPPENL